MVQLKGSLNQKLKLPSQISLPVFMSLIFALTASATDIRGNYPPYPDVWDWKPIHPAKTLGLGATPLYYIPNGDVLVQSEHSGLIGFFSRMTYKDPEATTLLGNALVDRRNRFPENQPPTLPNGKIVDVIAHDMACGTDYSSSEVFIEAPNGKTIASKRIVIFLDHPRHVPKVKCGIDQEEAVNGGYNQSTAMFAPSNYYVVPLADNTFLITDENTGMVLRLDDQLNSKSPLIGKTVFLIDSKQFDQFFNKHYFDETASRFFIELHDWVIALQKPAVN